LFSEPDDQRRQNLIVDNGLTIVARFLDGENRNQPLAIDRTGVGTVCASLCRVAIAAWFSFSW
jgi:hypothetical protein